MINSQNVGRVKVVYVQISAKSWNFPHLWFNPIRKMKVWSKDPISRGAPTPRRDNDTYRGLRPWLHCYDQQYQQTTSMAHKQSNVTWNPRHIPPPSVTKHNRDNPIAKKKIDKGEGLWQPIKEILGWIINERHTQFSFLKTKYRRSSSWPNRS